MQCYEPDPNCATALDWILVNLLLRIDIIIAKQPILWVTDPTSSFS